MKYICKVIVIKKVFPKAFVEGIEGVGLHLFKVNL